MRVLGISKLYTVRIFEKEKQNPAVTNDNNNCSVYNSTHCMLLPSLFEFFFFSGDSTVKEMLVSFFFPSRHHIFTELASQMMLMVALTTESYKPIDHISSFRRCTPRQQRQSK
jgi:hypothetical protein